MVKIEGERNNEISFSDPGTAMRDFYSWHFLGSKYDSTRTSQFHLLRRLHHSATGLGNSDTVLDLASGPQILERQYISGYGRPAFRFISIDFAEIGRLLARHSPKVSHIRANGEVLPLQDNSIAIAICNMGLEYMRPSAISELNRVIRSEGILHVNLWTKKESWEEYDERTDRHKLRPRQIRQMYFWKRFLNSEDRPLLGKNPEQVKEIFNQYGFQVDNIHEMYDTETSWVEVDMIKKGVDISLAA